MKRLINICLIFSFLLLTGCGWQFRGAGTNQQYDNIFIELSTPQYLNSQQQNFVEQLTLFIQRNNSPQAPTHYQLTLGNYWIETRNNSLSSSNTVRQRILSANLTYIVNGNTYEHNAQRYYFENEENVLASENEKQRLLKSLNDELSRAVWRQIQLLQQLSTTSEITQ